MKFRYLSMVATLLMALCVLAGAAQAQEQAGGLKQITESVYAYENVQPGTPGNHYLANAGIIVGEEEVLVVDTLTSADEAKIFLADIRKVTDKPIRYVVNTHYHLDHSLGNCVFAGKGVQIIAHESCKESLLKAGEQTIAAPQNFGLPEDFWRTTTIAAPNVTFEKEMAIDLGNVVVSLIHSGRASHSKGSIIVAVKEQDVLFAGDVLFTNFHPFLGEGDFDGWFATLDMLAAMNVSKIIPGHGPLSTNKDLADMKEYLKMFDENATKLSQEKETVEQIVAELAKTLPAREHGTFLIGFNVGMRYAPEAAKKEQ